MPKSDNDKPLIRKTKVDKKTGRRRTVIEELDVSSDKYKDKPELVRRMI